MEFQPIRPDLVRYEMRQVGGVNPHAQEQKRPGAFGRFLSGVGRFFGAVAAPLSIIFPPAAIAAAGMYGVGQIGDQMQFRTYQRLMEQSQQQRGQQVSFPGLELSDPNQIVPASDPTSQIPLSRRDEEVMNVLYARNASMLEMAKAL